MDVVIWTLIQPQQRDIATRQRRDDGSYYPRRRLWYEDRITRAPPVHASVSFQHRRAPPCTVDGPAQHRVQDLGIAQRAVEEKPQSPFI